MTKEQRLKKLREESKELLNRMSLIRERTLYNLIDYDILLNLSNWINILIENSTYKYKTEHVDYLENSLQIFINDLESGIYGEESGE